MASFYSAERVFAVAADGAGVPSFFCQLRAVFCLLTAADANVVEFWRLPRASFAPQAPCFMYVYVWG
jgi:hypothetical protein